jgi:uncharacterized protein
MFALPSFLCQRREVTADVLVFRSTTPPSGGIKPTVITLEPGRGQLLGISFFESQLGTAGDQWRSSAWTAITNSSLLLGEDLNQYSFSFDAEGNIDGPSAGGLFTSSTLALILGDSIKSNVTMTGTINPDGSIGPVGGIPLKVQAAHDQGKRRVVIPAGQLTPQIRELETELGIDVQEAANIFQAYELLTQQTLPLPVGFADVAPEMSNEGIAAVQESIDSLHQQYETERRGLNSASISAPFKPVDRAARDSFAHPNGRSAGAICLQPTPRPEKPCCGCGYCNTWRPPKRPWRNLRINPGMCRSSPGNGTPLRPRLKPYFKSWKPLR